MNRKIYLFLTVLLAWSFNLQAQTAQIETVTANPGDAVTFDIDVSGLPTNVGAVSLFIAYDPNVLTFTGSSAGTMSGYFINNMPAQNQVGIQWSDPNGADLNGTLLTLNFQYNFLGGSCDVSFAPGCEFADILLNTVTVSYTNGGISANPGVATVEIDELLATAGPVSLGVTGNGFTADAGAVTLFIKFDKSVLQFTGFSTTLPLAYVNGNNTTGMVSVSWSSPAGATLNAQFLTLNFNYSGVGMSELVFQNGCEITGTDLTPFVVSFDNGKVEPLATAYQLTIDDVVATPGNNVGVDVTAAGFPNNVGAMTLYVGFNPAHLTFLNLSYGTVTGAFASVVSPGVLGITWTNASGQSIDGTVFTMNFLYNFGSSPIVFQGGCEITDNGLALIPTTYNNGSISPVVGGPEVSLPLLTGTVGQPIDFPITAKNFTMDVAAISMFIGYNNAVLTYTGHTAGTLSGYFINNMSATSQIGIQWTDINGFDIDGAGDEDILLTLHFMYNGGVCDLTFNAGCEFAQADLTTVPVTFIDGGVISGTFFNVTVFLEGPYNGSTMNAYLNSLGLLPLAHPYGGAPWSYAGTESVAAIPNSSVVDWVLLEIRETTGTADDATAATMVAQQAGFLLENGSIVGLDGSSDILIPTSFSDNVYVVVHHRNHIKIMSANALTQVGGVYVYDFTDSAAKAWSGYQQAIGSGVYGMYAADFDADSEVFSGDVSILLNDYPTFGAYISSDADLDGEVFSGDVSFLLNNYPLFTSIP